MPPLQVLVGRIPSQFSLLPRNLSVAGLSLVSLSLLTAIAAVGGSVVQD